MLGALGTVFELCAGYTLSFFFLTSLLVGPTRNFSFSLSSNLFLIREVHAPVLISFIFLLAANIFG